jgi:hypothetical protein
MSIQIPAAAADRGLSEMGLTRKGMAQPGRQTMGQFHFTVYGYGVLANLRNLWEEGQGEGWGWGRVGLVG